MAVQFEDFKAYNDQGGILYTIELSSRPQANSGFKRYLSLYRIQCVTETAVTRLEGIGCFLSYIPVSKIMESDFILTRIVVLSSFPRRKLLNVINTPVALARRDSVEAVLPNI
jgi:hypothetical protein